MSLVDRPAVRKRTVRARIMAVEDGKAVGRREHIVGEEPLEIRAAGPGQEDTRVAVTMRTPGNDWDLAAGFLLTEGLVESREEIASIRYCGPEEGEQQFNVVTVRLRRPFDASALQRNFYATSSCGVCGKAAIDQVEVACAPIPPGPAVSAATVAALPEALRTAQEVFEETGGLHAAGMFTQDGRLLAVREDVGRHNAMDKLLGAAFLEGTLPAHDRIVLVSGRASFELVQKAAVAGVPVMCAVSAPSTLAVETADRLGVTLVAFLREGRFNLYAHPERIVFE